MFSVQQKRDIADAVQKILRETNHPELPSGEITFTLHVDGAENWSWADIRNNGAVVNPNVNPWNERQAQVSSPKAEARLSELNAASLAIDKILGEASAFSEGHENSDTFFRIQGLAQAASRSLAALRATERTPS